MFYERPSEDMIAKLKQNREKFIKKEVEIINSQKSLFDFD